MQRATKCPSPCRCTDVAELPPQVLSYVAVQFLVVGTGGLVLLYMSWPWESVEFLTLGIVHGLVNFAGGALSCWRSVRVMWVYQALLVAVFTTSAVTLSYMAGLADLNPMARGCLMGATDVLVKLLAGSVMPMPAFLPFLLLATVNAAVSCHVVGAWHDELVEPAQYVFIITTSLAALVHARAAQLWPAALREVRGQLSREEDTVESLLPMLTDGTCWLAPNANSIAQSDEQFQGLVGRRRLLSDCAPEARRRGLQSVLATLANTRGPLGPQTLQATLGPRRGQGLELIILDRRAARAQPGGGDRAPPERPAFFVGVARVARKPEKVLGPRMVEPLGAPAAASDLPISVLGQRLLEPSDTLGSPRSDESTRSPSAVTSTGSGSTAASSTSAAPQPLAPARPGPPPAPPAGPAAAPAGRAPPRPVPAQEGARLPELRELAVEFDALSPQFKVRSCTLHFAHEAAGLQLPRLMDFLQAPHAAAFQTWAQERANSAFAAEGGPEETTLQVPSTCEIVFSVPTLGMALVGETAELHIAPDEELEEPEVLATLRLRDLTQLRRRRHRERRAARGGNNLGNANPRLRPNGLRTIDESRMHSGTTPDVSLEQHSR